MTASSCCAVDLRLEMTGESDVENRSRSTVVPTGPD